MLYVEQNCCFEHEGKHFCAGGAAVSDTHCIAYLSADNVLTDWHGQPIGTYRITRTWRTQRSYVSYVMHQVYATVDGKTYTGRGAGVGMVFKGKRVAAP
jgi:hypothetical protein